MTAPLEPFGPGHSAELEELAAGFALGALDAPDDARFRAHLPDCPRCRSLVRRYDRVVVALPYALEPLESASDLGQRIVDAVRAEQAGAPTDGAAERAGRVPLRAPPARGVPDRTLRWALPLAALFAAILGLGYWNVRLQQQHREQVAALEQQLRQQAAALQVQQRALAAAASGGRRVELAGTDQARGASGLLVQPPDGSPPYLLASDLPPLPADRTYQAWVIAGGVPAPAGQLERGRDGPAIAQLDRPVAAGDMVAVTIEPAGGSQAPTGSILVAGQV